MSLDTILHALGGALIFWLGGFFLPAVPILSPLSGLIVGAIYGLLREQAQHTDGGFFDFSWITISRLREGVAWGVGAMLMAESIAIIGPLLSIAALFALAVIVFAVPFITAAMIQKEMTDGSDS